MSALEVLAAVARLLQLVSKMVADGADVPAEITRIEKSYEARRKGDQTFADAKRKKFGK